MDCSSAAPSVNDDARTFPIPAATIIPLILDAIEFPAFSPA